MANKISFLIQMKDQFGRTADKVNRQFGKIKQSADKAGNSVSQFALKTKKSLDGVGKRAAAVGAAMTAAVTVPLAMFGKAAIKAASDAQETQGKFNAVYSTIKSQANNAADAFAKKFSLARSTAREMIGDTGDLLVGFGFAGQEALSMSEKISKLALDLDSFQNLEGGAAQASKALTASLSGNTEALKSLGIVVNQLDPKFKAALKTNLRAASGDIVRAKALTILGVAFDQTKAAQGQYMREADTYAGIIRRQAEASKALRESVGAVLLPYATKFAQMLTVLFNKFNDLPQPIKDLVVIFGGLLAIGGPLLILLGGIAIAVAVISAPVLAAVAAVGLLIAAGLMLWKNWDGVVGGAKLLWEDLGNFVTSVGEKIASTFSSVWESVKSALVSFINFAIRQINTLLAPLDFVAQKLGLGSVSIKEIAAPSTPVSNAGGLFQGDITVSAEPGTKVTKTRTRNRGRNMNVGMNMAYP